MAAVHDIAVIFRDSSNRKQKLKDVVNDHQEQRERGLENNETSEHEQMIRQIAADITVADSDSCAPKMTVLALCTMRWCVRACALKRALELWPSIRLAVDQLAKERCRPETKTKLLSLQKSMAKAKTYLAVLISKTVSVL